MRKPQTQIVALSLALTLLAVLAGPAIAQPRVNLVTAVGGGDSYELAYDNAVDGLSDHGIVMHASINELSAECNDVPVIGGGTITLCRVELEARVIPFP